MTGDVLVPILITFLVVNVILLVRAGAKGQLRRLGPAAAGRPPDPQLAASPAPAEELAPEPAAVDPPDLPDEEEVPEPAVPYPPDEEEVPEPTLPDPPAVLRVLPLSGRDRLTGLDDEATWDWRVADESTRVRRYRRPVTIVRLEIDGLDRLTGLLGEEAGDRLLRAMADTLRRLARDTDHVGRIGRGGFGVLMPETSEEAAGGYVERVSRACEVWLESGAIAVRLAVGWAATSGDVGLAEILRLATERMYREQWRDMRRAATAASSPAPSDAARPPVTDAPSAPPP
ncbi:MAG: GGDEF domain-containing protein, partial [Chloroflexi bacterium]|nr:GGDEF domain-containing protein [Chloroflexota bacterium]